MSQLDSLMTKGKEFLYNNFKNFKTQCNFTFYLFLISILKEASEKYFYEKKIFQTGQDQFYRHLSNERVKRTFYFPAAQPIYAIGIGFKPICCKISEKNTFFRFMARNRKISPDHSIDNFMFGIRTSGSFLIIFMNNKKLLIQSHKVT